VPALAAAGFQLIVPDLRGFGASDKPERIEQYTIPDMTMKRATGITWEAHTKGWAVAKTCHKELAELYEERLREKGLTVSIESAG
jgi:pimeloyl-ACP methyl ester carboxylesterase